MNMNVSHCLEGEGEGEDENSLNLAVQEIHTRWMLLSVAIVIFAQNTHD